MPPTPPGAGTGPGPRSAPLPGPEPAGAVRWREAMERALYGTGGFYRSLEGPAGHFRTSVHVSAAFAGALARLAADAGLDLVIDVGAGRGELLSALHRLDPRLRLHGIDVVPRPAGLPAVIGWSGPFPAAALPRGAPVHDGSGGGEPGRAQHRYAQPRDAQPRDAPHRGAQDRAGPDAAGADRALVVANEWLDNVPVDVVEQTAGGPRLVLVDPATGAEHRNGPPTGRDAAWLARWWPLAGAEPGSRAEVGTSRDDAWAAVISALRGGPALGVRLRGGIAVAADYGHLLARRPPGGTLIGYRGGHAVAPVPDGSVDLTAHVALDACAAAGARAGTGDGGCETLLTTQRAALHALGVIGRRPPPALAGADPPAYLAALVAAGEAAELTDRGGLGAHGWLVQAVGMPLPAVLAGSDLDE